MLHLLTENLGSGCYSCPEPCLLVQSTVELHVVSVRSSWIEPLLQCQYSVNAALQGWRSPMKLEPVEKVKIINE